MSRLFSATLRAGLVSALMLSSVVRLSAQEAPTRAPQTAERMGTEFILGLASNRQTVDADQIRRLDAKIGYACTKFSTLGLAKLADFEAKLNSSLEKKLADVAQARQVWIDRYSGDDVTARDQARYDCTEKARKLAIQLYANERLIPCIRRREGDLRRGEAGLPVAIGTGDRRLEGTWVTGKCEGQPAGIEADWKGGISMILHPDGSAKGTIYGSPGSEGTVLTGTHRPGGHFEAFAPDVSHLHTYVRLEGSVTPAVPGENTATGSGTLRYGADDGHTSYVCYGTWAAK